MKHCYKLFAAALMVVLSTLILPGCNKSADPADEALKQGEATLARIMDFKQQVDYYKANPDVKDGEAVTLDEAIWNIEALFNLTYAYPDLSYGRTETADTVLYLPVGSDNTVLLTDLTVFYGQMYEVISDIYHGIELDNKQFLILDVEEDDVPSGGRLPIQLHSVQGTVKGTPPPVPEPIMWMPFASGIKWWYGVKGGNNQNDFYGEMDAADTLSGMLNAILVPKAPENYEYIYSQILIKRTSQDLIEHYHNPYSGFSEIQPRYCEFFIENPSLDEYWMDADRMNFHYFGERHMVLNILPHRDTPIPSNLSLYKIIVEDNQIIKPNGDVIIGHYTEASYGHRDIIGHNIVIKGNL